MRSAAVVNQFVMSGVTAAIVAAVLFGCGSRPRPPGFRVFPASLAEWVAFWFHTLELLLCCSLLAAQPPANRYLPFVRVADLVVFSAILAFLLLASAAAFWKINRSLCRGALGWFCAFALYLVFSLHHAVTDD